MFSKGLTSVSFRELSPEQVILTAKENNISSIEWGGDIHAPANDTARLDEIVALMEKHGVSCCSYGSYFTLGRDSVDALPEIISAAKRLGTDIIRIWCGTKASGEYSEDEVRQVIADAKAAAALAENLGVTLCLECHPNTLTDRAESSLRILRSVGSEHFRTCWQPNQFISEEDNLDHLTAVLPYLQNIHIFNWTATERLPLALSKAEWIRRLSLIRSDHFLLFEFMPNGKTDDLPAEVRALDEIISEVQK